ncbi:histidine--tRNA ligase [candidate division NPL-UPA2 bacterium]|nr:histidine--tRNA ligase [candidate division NPL-UPA2 bacterium]
MLFRAVRGMKDILPEEVGIWDHLERLARRSFQLYCYGEIRTPLVEETELFVRGIGETSDIVSKQMYTFPDRKGRSLTLRPEGTAPVIRAYLEHGLHRQGSLQKLFYIGSFFRSERPQAGRGREFHQIGAEAIGSESPALDAEMIALAIHLLRAFGLERLKINLNSIGCSSCQPDYREVLRKDLKTNTDSLCSDCQDRIERSPLRVLDCKREECQPLIEKAPSISGYLCPPCARHFYSVQVYLEELGIDYCLDPHLVRGLDYYTRTAFEITHEHLGAQNALAAGGRFDGLVKEMGGASTPAVGFALGMERVILARGGKLKPPARLLSVYLAPQGEEAGQEAAKLLQRLRGEGIDSDMDYEGRSLKGQLRLANRLQVKHVLIIPKKGIVVLKDMQSGEQEELKTEHVVERLKEQLAVNS